MSKFVIAGSSICPYYAKVELLADQLALNLPDFTVHKIVKHPEEWQEWLTGTCDRNGWLHGRSPIVWRELVDRGGKGVLVGGANEFQEYARSYYGLQSAMDSSDMLQVAEENRATRIAVTQEDRHQKSLSHPLHVTITNAGHPVAYHLLHTIAGGRVFGAQTEVSLRLLAGSGDALGALEGVAMEARDLALPLLKEVVVTTETERALEGASTVIFLDELIQGEEEIREEWLQRYGRLFTSYGQTLERLARREVKVLVGGSGPLNLTTYLLHKAAPSIPKQSFVAVSRLAECRAKAAVARKLGVNSAEVTDLLVWGAPNGTRHHDLSLAKVHGYEGAIRGPAWFSRSVLEMVHDGKWVETELVEGLKSHEAELGSAPNLSTAAAILGVLVDWCNGTGGSQLFSLGVVVSEGWYDLPDEMVFSLPVKFQKGSWEVVQDLEISDVLKDKLSQISKELIAEKHIMFPPPRPLTPETSQPDASDSTPKDEEKIFGQDEKPEEAEAGGGSEEDKEMDARSLQTITEVEEALETDRELTEGKLTASPKPEGESGQEEGETSAGDGEAQPKAQPNSTPTTDSQ